jgi:hypothetical protein
MLTGTLFSLSSSVTIFTTIIINIILFSLALQPSVGYGLIIRQVS